MVLGAMADPEQNRRAARIIGVYRGCAAGGHRVCCQSILSWPGSSAMKRLEEVRPIDPQPPEFEIWYLEKSGVSSF
jgi:hypothetical protein